MDITKKIWINLFARRRFHKFNDRLLRRGLIGLGVGDFGPRQESGERWLLQRMAEVLPQKAVVLDVGAHAGSYSMFLAERRPDLAIHAFEPNPAVYAELVANANGRFATYSFALGDEESEAMLHIPEKTGNSECSLVDADIQKQYRDEPHRLVPVKVKTLDRVLDDLKLDRIDYLKIDAEGYDLKVLRGAAPRIQAGRLGVVQFEIHPMNVFSRIFMRDFYELLPKHRMHRIVRDGLVPLGTYNPATCELFGLQNIVAVPENDLAWVV
jgi:FkbM family methyltransferase